MKLHVDLFNRGWFAIKSKGECDCVMLHLVLE